MAKRTTTTSSSSKSNTSVIFCIINIANICACVDATIERYIDDFGNPQTDVAACGRNGRPSYICDPDQILTFDQDNHLDSLIQDILNSTSCPCSSSSCRSTRAGYLVTFAILNKIKVNASQENNESPTNDNDHALRLNTVLNAARNLAYELQRKWNFGTCGVLVLFSRQDNVLYTVAEPVAGQKLSSDLIGEIAMDVRSDFAQSIFKGFNKLLTEYRAVFSSSYQQKTRWEELKMPESHPVVAASSHLIHFYVYFYTLVTVLITCLLQM